MPEIPPSPITPEETPQIRDPIRSPDASPATRVVFRVAGEEIGFIYRDRGGPLAATTERVEWILESPVDVPSRWVQPDDHDFLDASPLVYSGSLLTCEIVERAEGRPADASPRG